MSKERIRKLWGTDEQYYKELEAFHKQHNDAHSITYDNETKCPVSATYYFLPWAVYVDHVQLMKKLPEMSINREELANDGE